METLKCGADIQTLPPQYKKSELFALTGGRDAKTSKPSHAGCHVAMVMFAGCFVAMVMFAGCFVAMVMFTGCHVAMVMFAGCYIAMVMLAGCYIAMVIFAGCGEGVPGEGYETRSRDHRVRAGAECGNHRHGNAWDGQDQTHDPGISQ